MFWEEALLTIACDWTKTQALSGAERKKMQKMMVKTCTPRTSHIFIRCALVTKSAESRIVRTKLGAEAAAIHWASFAARNGDSMCEQRNYLWALSQFNKAALKFCNLTLHPLRHVWIAWCACRSITEQVVCNSQIRSRRVAVEVANQHGDSGVERRILAVAALMSNHSLETEEATYAGESHIGGAETFERKDFKRLSKAFNERVFGQQVKARMQSENSDGIVHLLPVPPTLPRCNNPFPHLLRSGTNAAVGGGGNHPSLPEESTSTTARVNDSEVLDPKPVAILNSKGFIDKTAVVEELSQMSVLLGLRPGSGKTQLIVDLVDPSRLLLIMVPTIALQQQVRERQEYKLF